MAVWKPGDRIFAYWEADGYWYPATITKVDGDDLYVRYDDGEDEVTSDDYVDWLSVSVGDAVESKSSQEGDDLYYDGEVIEVDGDRVLVEFEDSTREWTDVANVRVADDEEEE